MTPADHKKSEDAKESIHSMCDADFWAWRLVEIKINARTKVHSAERQLVATL
jgi:hypothetical protein